MHTLLAIPERHLPRFNAQEQRLHLANEGNRGAVLSSLACFIACRASCGHVVASQGCFARSE
jgi:hypothetical protein